MTTTIRQSPAARLFNEAAWTLCNQIADDYGFTLSWEDDANGRVLMLLGPDSPSEMTMRLRRADLDGSRAEATAGRVIRWMLERGAYWTGREMNLKGHD